MELPTFGRHRPMNHKLSTHSPDVILTEDLLARESTDRLFIEARLGEPEEELQRYKEGHIVGAVYAQIRDVFAGAQTSHTGSLPLPELSGLERGLLGWGVGSKTEIVVYGPTLAHAARGWWTLRWAGLKYVRVLDGGLRAWVEQGGAVAQGAAAPRVPTTERLNLRGGILPQIDVDAVEALEASTLKIDAREEAFYLAGHLPGAINVPASELWTPSGRFRTTAQLQELYGRTGVKGRDDVVVYCGGGVLSALHVLVLRSIGIEAQLYVGSWSEWSKSSERLARSSVAGVAV